MSDLVEKHIIAELEAQRYKAMRDADIAILDRLLSAELSYTHSDGATDNKESYLRGVKTGKWKYRSIEPFYHEIRIFRELAVITGDIRIDVDIEKVATQLNCRFLCIWQKKTDTWKLSVWQATRRLNGGTGQHKVQSLFD